MPALHVLLAGGGTAGHVEPALAVASWLKGVKPEWQLTFVGTKNGLENQLVPKAGIGLRVKKDAYDEFLQKILDI